MAMRELWLSGFSKSLKNIVLSPWVEIDLNIALEFLVLLQGWNGGHSFEYSTHWTKKGF